MNKAQIHAWRQSLRGNRGGPVRAPAPAQPAVVTVQESDGKVRAEVTGPGQITMRLGELTIVAQRGWVGRGQRVWLMNDGQLTLGEVLTLLWPERDRRNTAWLQAQLDQQYANHERRTR